VRIMMSLQGDVPVGAISAYLAAQHVNVLAFEELADEGATITEVGDAPAVVEHERSALRAIWIVDVASRAAAVELAKNAPGDDATLEVRESFTAQDFGAPPDPDPPMPPPPSVRKPGTHRFIAFIRSHDEARVDGPHGRVLRTTRREQHDDRWPGLEAEHQRNARAAFGVATIHPRRTVH